MVRAVKVVAVALELGRHVLREEGHVGDAHRVDGRMEVDEGRGAVGELQRDAHAGGRGRDRGRAGTCRARRASCGDLGAGAGHQRVRRVLLSKQLRLQAVGHRKDGHDHGVVRVFLAACRGIVVFIRLRDPRVAVGGRVEGGRPLKRELRVGRRACLVEVAVPELGDGGVRAVDHWALLEVRVVLAHDVTAVALALPLVKELLLVAREGVVGAVVVVRLDHVEGLRADLDLIRVLVELAVELVRVRLRLGLDVRAQVRAHEVVHVALELGRGVGGEEGHVLDARRGDGGMKVGVGRRVGGEGQRVARTGRRGRGDGPLRAHDDAGPGHQGGGLLRQLEEVLGVRRVHVKDDELHLGVGVRAIHRLRHPLVGAVRRDEGAAPLVLSSGLLARALKGDRRRTDGSRVIAVNREWVVDLALSTRALFLHDAVGTRGVGWGQRGRHQERAGDDGQHLDER
mmetsp:Transcript_23059/g.54848  ORF Transcript_23059/g.54848 Transcript_23059/m.54848 type:complete len:456 (-) Transcript_23059:22-1389(-)